MSKKLIRVNYEIPPMRAIYSVYYEDEGQTDEEVRKDFETNINLVGLGPGMEKKILSIKRVTEKGL